MFCNEEISILQRSRVFNIHISPDINSKIKSGLFTSDKRCIAYKYKFSKDTIKSTNPMTLQSLRDTFEYENCSEEFESMSSTLDMNKSLIIGVFYIGPRRTKHSSLYSFEKNKFDDGKYILVGDPDEDYKVNTWFNNKMLKIRINWEKLGSDINDFVNDGYNSILIRKDEIRESMYMLCFDDKDLDPDNPNAMISNKFKIELVDLETQKFIRDTYKEYNGKIIILNVVNYLINYFLVAAYEKDVENKYKFTFIPSPGDNSLSS